MVKPFWMIFTDGTEIILTMGGVHATRTCAEWRACHMERITTIQIGDPIKPRMRQNIFILPCAKYDELRKPIRALV